MEREIEIEQLKRRDTSLSAVAEQLDNRSTTELEELEKLLQTALSKVSREIGRRQIT